MTKFKSVNPTGFHCVNVLIRKAIGKVKQKAHARSHAEAKRWDNPVIKQSINRRRPSKIQTSGFKCVNKMVKVVIGKIITKAKQRREMKDKRVARPEHYKQTNQKAQVKFYKANKEKVLAWNREQRIVKHDSYLERTRNRRKERRLSDTEYVIKDRIRSRLRSALLRNGVDKTISTFALVGCSSKELLDYVCLIDGDDIDHIFPFEQFHLEDEEEQRKVCHYSNLQSLTPGENGNKSAKLPTKAMAAKVNRDCWPEGITEDMLPDIYPGWETPLRMHAP